MPDHADPKTNLSRRGLLAASGFALASLGVPASAFAQAGRASFAQWRAIFKPRALARGVSDQTYDRAMDIAPDTSVYALDRNQAEFNEQLWQYLNRRVSDWRIMTGKERVREHSALLARIETDYGVDRYALLALWGMESAFGDVVLNPKHMRPIIPALAALAWGDARRRTYWEAELLNALVIVEKGWAQPKEMIGSWAGAMGHTQWMPEVWLRMGVDYNRDGRVQPFGPPDDALAGTARYIAERGKWKRGEAWGMEVRVPAGVNGSTASRGYSAWSSAGVTRGDGRPLPGVDHAAKLWQPVSGGPSFLIGQNFNALRSYNPSNSYALAIAHLGDRIRGDAAFAAQFPGGERALTLPEVQEVQKRLTAQGFDTDGVDGRVGRETMLAVRNFQRKVGISPADGYAGLTVLAALRQGA